MLLRHQSIQNVVENYD